MTTGRNKRKTSGKSDTSRRKPKTKSRPKRSKMEVAVKTRFSPQLSWSYPYILKAKKMMPNLVMPSRIRCFKPSRSKIMRVMGNAYFDNRTVVVATHTQQTYLTKKGMLRVKRVVRLSKAQILDTLAHEIAHFQYPDHGYEHEEFTRAIFKTFGLKEKCPHCKGTGKIQLEGKPG